MLKGFLFPLTYNIYGNISDLNTLQELNNVSVYIENEDIGTTTNKDGYFNLLINNYEGINIDLNIELVGYEEKVISINLFKENIDLNKIFLKNKPIELETIHIHSNKDKSNQISDILLAGFDLNKNLKSDIATTLSNQPNIGINSFGGATSKPSLRGFSGDRFLLTKDASKVGDLSQSSIDHAIALDMTQVSQIEIIRGPRSLIFGPNTIGGVINASIDGNPKMRVDKFKTKIVFGSESFNPKGLSLYNEGVYFSMFSFIPVDKNNQLNLSISNRLNQNQSSPIGILENTNSNTKSYKIGFTHYNNNNYYLNFIFEDFNMEYGIPPTPSGHTTGIDIPLLKKSFQFNYHHDISLNIFDEVNLKYNYIFYEHQEAINNNNNFEVLLAKTTSNFKIEFNSKNLLIGSEISMEKFNPEGFYLTPTTDEINISLYGFYEKKYANINLDFLSSFRLGYLSIIPGEYNFTNGNSNLILEDNEGNPILDDQGNRISLVRDRTFENLSFSFGVRKKINKFEINSWIMHTMRPPRVEELYSDGPHLATYAFEIGNPNLKSEKIYGIENSVSYSSNHFNFSFVTFYNYSPYYFQMTKDGNCEEAWDWNPYSGLSHPCAGADWIDWGSAPVGWLYEYSPKGNEVIIKGFEINLAYHMDNIHLNYNFSYVEGYNETLKLPLSYMNPIKQIFNLEYIYHSMNYKFRFSKIHAQDKLGEFETYTSGAFLTDFIFGYNFHNHNITIQFNNIFNEKYYNHLSRIKNITPESGRNIHFVYKIIF